MPFDEGVSLQGAGALLDGPRPEPLAPSAHGRLAPSLAAPLRGQSIVCFAKDWQDDPTSNTHVMRRLARDNRVLWVDSIAMRAPRVSSGRDLAKIARRLRSAFHGARRVENDLWVLAPTTLPLPHSPWAVALNRAILRVTLGLQLRRLRMDAVQLWAFLPSAVEYLGALRESLVVYYCVDDWPHASGYHGARLAEMERRLCTRADLVFATSRPLRHRLRRWNPRTHLASHGVDHAHFARALAPSTAPAPELAGLRPPVLGVMGFIDDRVDVALLATLAAAHPEWSIAIVGRTAVDLSPLASHRNVHLLGHQPYARLPELCKGFAAGLIPFRLTPYTQHVNPIKLREYLSAGLPVVSTALPEVARYGDLCTVASDHASFIASVEAELRRDSAARRARRSAAMSSETWEARVREIGATVAELTARATRVRARGLS